MSAVNIRSILAEEHDENETDWYPDLEDEDYHTDKTTVGSTSLRKILKPNGSLQQFYRHFFLGEQNEETKEQRLGKLVHKAVLEGGVFLKHYVVEPVWDVVSRYLKARRTIAPVRVNLPAIDGVTRDPGYAES